MLQEKHCISVVIYSNIIVIASNLTAISRSICDQQGTYLLITSSKVDIIQSS